MADEWRVTKSGANVMHSGEEGAARVSKAGAAVMHSGEPGSARVTKAGAFVMYPVVFGGLPGRRRQAMVVN